MNGLRNGRQGSLLKVMWLSNALFVLVLCLALWFSHQQYIRYAEERASNTTLTLERTLSGMLDQINLMLIAVQDELERDLREGNGDQKRVNLLIHRLAPNAPGVIALRYADATGLAPANAGFPSGNAPVSLADRDYFQQLRDGAEATMVHSKPVVGRINGKWSIIFARAYRSPSGAFAGVVLASVDMAHFSNMFAALKLGERSNTTLISDLDYVMLARYPLPPDLSFLGRRIPLQSVIDRLKAGPAVMVFHNTPRTDGIERITAVRKLEGRPYWISVGLSVEDELAPWRKQAGMALAVMLIFATLTGSAGLQLRHGWRRREEALATLSTTLEASDNGILVVGRSGRVLHRNQRLAELWHITADLVDSDNEKVLLDYVQEQLKDPEGFIRGVKTLYENPELKAFDILRFKDGRIFERTSIPMRMFGKTLGRIWSFRDISERERMESLLRHERDRAQSYLDTVEAVIVSLDVTGHITSINRKGCLLLGWSESELLGKFWFEMCLPQPAGQEQVYPYFLEMVSGNEAFSEYFENEVVTRAGERRDVAWHNAVLFDAHAQIVGVLSAGEDITERKRREVELEGYHNSLELLVHARTAELAVAKERAETSNRAKSAFLANMSHELRTPLNAILGFARLLEKKEGMDPESQRQLATINRSGQHLLALINDVLEISRIEAGHAEFKSAVFALPDLLRDVSEMIRVRALDKGLQFDVEIIEALPHYVRGDAQHLKQVLINLLSNAVKYTDQGCVSLRVGPQNGQMVFDVRDTGPGIAPQDQAKLFKAFYQTDAGIAKGEGTGLGLAISFEFARLMGGTLGVTSELGQGSVFTLKLVLAPADAPAQGNGKPAGQIIGLAAESGTPRVLVVDDKADNREMIEQMLGSVGFAVQSVDDGQKAIAAFLAWQPQFIWMDMRMPVMDGFEATRQIRALPGGATVKIVALTASAFEEDRRGILAAGCDDWVSKPVEEDQLLAVMEGQLGLRYRYAVAAAAAAPSPESLSLAGLPSELIAQLKRAADALDMELVRSTIGQIGALRPALADALGTMFAEFRFDRIAALCDKV